MNINKMQRQQRSGPNPKLAEFYQSWWNPVDWPNDIAKGIAAFFDIFVAGPFWVIFGTPLKYLFYFILIVIVIVIIYKISGGSQPSQEEPIIVVVDPSRQALQRV